MKRLNTQWQQSKVQTRIMHQVKIYLKG